MIGNSGKNQPGPITLPFGPVDALRPKFSIPVVGPQAEVQGFSMPASTEAPTQQQADSLGAKLQTFYDALPEQERLILGAVLGQAAAYCE